MSGNILYAKFKVPTFFVLQRLYLKKNGLSNCQMLTNCFLYDSESSLLLKERIMSCFGCCSEDSMQKTADNGPYTTNHAAGYFQGLLCISGYLIIVLRVNYNVCTWSLPCVPEVHFIKVVYLEFTQTLQFVYYANSNINGFESDFV